MLSTCTIGNERQALWKRFRVGARCAPYCLDFHFYVLIFFFFPCDSVSDVAYFFKHISCCFLFFFFFCKGLFYKLIKGCFALSLVETQVSSTASNVDTEVALSKWSVRKEANTPRSNVFFLCVCDRPLSQEGSKRQTISLNRRALKSQQRLLCEVGTCASKEQVNTALKAGYVKPPFVNILINALLCFFFFYYLLYYAVLFLFFVYFFCSKPSTSGKKQKTHMLLCATAFCAHTYYPTHPSTFATVFFFFFS